MFKALFFLFLLAFNISFASQEFDRFDIVEIKNSKKSDTSAPLQMKSKKRFGVVFSGKNHNSSSKNLVIAPVVLKKKDYTGKFIVKFKSGGREYIIFTNKLRNIEKSKVFKSTVSLDKRGKDEIQKQFINVVE